MSDSGGVLPYGARWLANLVWFIGETARPLCMLIIGIATAAGFLNRLDIGSLGIMSTLLGALYGAKAAERIQQTRSDAKTAAATAIANGNGNGNGTAKVEV